MVKGFSAYVHLKGLAHCCPINFHENGRAVWLGEIRGSGSQCKVVGQEGVMNAGISIFLANTTKPDRAVFCLGAGQLNGLIAGQTFGIEHPSALNDPVSSVCF